jgi:hypothetical protein
MEEPADFFLKPSHPLQRRYEALRAHLVERLPAEEVARRFGYTPHSVEVLASRLRNDQLPPFFRDIPHGRKDRPVAGPLREAILELREQRLSILDISERLKAEGRPVSFHTVWLMLRDAGIGRLPKRSAAERASPPKLRPPVADVSGYVPTTGCKVQCRTPFVLLFAPLLARLEFDSLVRKAGYPGTSMVPSPSYLRSLLALKLLFRPRKNHVMPIADDEGFGLFAGLNVLPKTTALSDYSYRVGPKPHRALLRGIVKERDVMGAYPGLSFNLDFHAIRHYGDVENSALEKDYVPRRSQSVAAVVASFAQEFGSRELVYSNANLLKREKKDEVLQFVDFWRGTTGKLPEELVFDAHMTTHEGLAELERKGIKFITLRERRQPEVQRVIAEPTERWKRVSLDVENRKWKTPRVLDEKVELSDYPGRIRQIAALDLGREEPTFILTNEMRRGPAALLTRYARRALIENSLGEQVSFFHVDALSSSVRIKVDLDVVLSVVASGCYRWLARQLKGFENATARTLWESFLDRPGTVRLTKDHVVLCVRRFSRAPALLESMVSHDSTPIPWLGDRTVRVKIL